MENYVLKDYDDGETTFIRLTEDQTNLLNWLVAHDLLLDSIEVIKFGDLEFMPI